MPSDGQVEDLFHVAQEAAGLVRHVGDVAALRVRPDDDDRHAEAEAHVVGLRRGNVVVEAAPVVPRDEDGGRVPVLGSAPIALTMLATQSGPCAGAPGWSELLNAGTIQVTCASLPLAMSVSTWVSGEITSLVPVRAEADVPDRLVGGEDEE